MPQGTPLGREPAGELLRFSGAWPTNRGIQVLPRTHVPVLHPATSRFGSEIRAGVICNSRARHNLSSDVQSLKGSVCAMPRSHAELHDVLRSFAARNINLLIIDGGDGTVRDVISAAKHHFRHAFPRLAVVPSGKTNALALDLGIPRDWTIESALDAARHGRTALRSPIEVSRRGESETPIRGFIFGTGAFLRATALAQKTHRIGAFNGLAVGLSILGSVAQTAFGGRDNVWRRGDMLRIEWPDGRVVERAHYLTLASTLRNLPTGIKPFGRLRDGLKLLNIDAPPKRILTSVPTLLRGSEAVSLERDGYHRTEIDEIGMTIETGFVLDGEAYPGGDLVLRRGDPIRFAVP